MEAFIRIVEQSAVDLAVVTSPSNIAYLSGLEIDAHERVTALFISKVHAPLLFVPELEAKRSALETGLEVFSYSDSQNPWEVIKNHLSNLTVERAFVEFADLNLAKAEGLKSAFQNLEFSDVTPIFEKLRLIKSEDEIEKLKEAGRYADQCFEIGFELAKAGVSELEIAAGIELAMKREGISKMSFETIVLSGERAASPHGFPQALPTEKDKLLLFDLGVMSQGYASDATRTIALGLPPAFDLEVYKWVLEAQMQALDFAKAGVYASEIDKVARDILDKADLGQYFTHRLGHGIGRDVHEYPSIGGADDLLIQTGMCFSIEPGVYIPGKVGVRIEDCVYITDKGAIPFTNTSKELISL